MDFDIEEGGVTKYFYLTREDGREFTLTRFYDVNLDQFDEQVEADDGKPVTKEEKEAVKKAVRAFLGEE